MKSLSAVRSFVLLAVLSVALACGGGPGSHGSSRPPVIPWTDRPGIPSSLAGSAHAARPCGAADLDVAASRSGAFRGKATQELQLRNHAKDACYLAGSPQARLSSGGGQSKVDSGRFSAQRLDLAPGQSADLLIGAPVGCAASDNPRLASSMTLTLPNGETVAVQGIRVNMECGPADVDDFASTGSPPVQPGPLSALKLSLAAPSSVARGGVLAYHVAVHNTSNAAIAFSPCPSYTEGVGTGSATDVQSTLVLNCAAAPSIGAGATLTYEMKLPVAASVPAGPTKLFWHLEVPEGPTAGTVIAVT